MAEAPGENRLGSETSPYLLQHRHDPVDWYPWGTEAFARASELDLPVFLSIGYSACHWCHVMGHESFADEATAAEMNKTVVAVKVDREERPDVDAVYMEAVQAATGHGGWPMSVFATPDGRPFYAGTYFPDRPRGGMPAFRQVLAAVGEAWRERRQAITEQADALSGAVARRLAPPVFDDEAGDAPGDEAGDEPGGRPGGAEEDGGGARPSAARGAPHLGRAVDAAVAETAVIAACRRLVDMSDAAYGGFGTAPKFPQPLFLDLLLHAHAEGLDPDGLAPGRMLEVVLLALEGMASGGIWDHVGGGFSRYSVDRKWLVPHFEKMLYDQAQLGRVFLHAWQLTRDERWRQVLEEIVGYVLRDMGVGDGAIAAAEDADSEGEEGLFYTWTPLEMEAVLGPALAARAFEWWGVTPDGNFEGRSILFRAERGDLLRPPEIEEARQRLLAARSRRVRPGRDTKVLTEWNAMMCATLAEAALATGEVSWKDAALRIGEQLAGACRRREDGRVLRCPPRPAAGELLGYSPDAAWMIEAFVRLAECSGDAQWTVLAAELATQLVSLFGDGHGGLFTSGSDAEELVVRPRELYDNVTPSASSVAAGALARLGALSSEPGWTEEAARLLGSGAELLRRAPTAVPGLAVAADLVTAGVVAVAVTGDRPDLVSAASHDYRPRVVVAYGSGLALLADRPPGKAFVCRNGACRLPAETAKEMTGELQLATKR